MCQIDAVVLTTLYVAQLGGNLRAGDRASIVRKVYREVGGNVAIKDIVAAIDAAIPIVKARPQLCYTPFDVTREMTRVIPAIKKGECYELL